MQRQDVGGEKTSKGEYAFVFTGHNIVKRVDPFVSNEHPVSLLLFESSLKPPIYSTSNQWFHIGTRCRFLDSAHAFSCSAITPAQQIN